MESLKVFIVEDDKLYGDMLRYHLALNPDNEVFLYSTGKECIDNLYRDPDFISLDYSLPDTSGLEVMQKIHGYNAKLPVVIVSGQDDVNTAVNLLKEGAYDYFVKDEDTKNRLWHSLQKVRENMALKQEIKQLKDEIGKKYEFRNVIKGNSPAIRRIFDLIEKATQTNIVVSLLGETGTGKDLVAKAIHYNSPRKAGPFVPINVSAIPSELIESEFFGYEKGAFTGATTRKQGKFEQANNGTIFLDEIAEMDTNMQTKLLRVLQEKELTRVGGNQTIKFDARVIVATNKDLATEVSRRNFREDLYYRLLGLPIELPPLRDRGDDVLILAKFFLDEFCKDNNLENKTISLLAQKRLMMYPYPGNVRELKAIIDLSAVMSSSNVIEESDISFSKKNFASDLLHDDDTLEGYTKKIVTHYLKKYDRNVLKVARKLNIGKSTVYRMMKEIEL
ncbi:MAG: sigma-54 dependent transcriptional regulator [Bacteroidales bacterium]|jgi:DNA-binding NtrC family response regulator|nr:sigma-54 dependent transcriptional regulator [Bacteroidales bacterium]